MFIPTWGPLILICLLMFVQFVPIRKKLGKGDHVVMLVAAAIFGLTASYTVREFTPPELTLAEASLFGLSLIYVIILMFIIHGGHYAQN